MRHRIPVLLLLVGCDVTDVASQPFDTAEASCPTGMSAASSADLQFNDLQIDGVAAFVTFDGVTTTPDGQPPVCVNASGTEARYVLSADGVFQGLLSVFAPQAGTFDLGTGGASLTVELDGDVVDTAIDESTWEEATVLAVDSVGPVLDWQVSNGVSKGTSGGVVYVEAFGTATVPVAP